MKVCCLLQRKYVTLVLSLRLFDSLIHLSLVYLMMLLMSSDNSYKLEKMAVWLEE